MINEIRQWFDDHNIKGLPTNMKLHCHHLGKLFSVIDEKDKLIQELKEECNKLKLEVEGWVNFASKTHCERYQEEVRSFGIELRLTDECNNLKMEKEKLFKEGQSSYRAIDTLGYSCEAFYEKQKLYREALKNIITVAHNKFATAQTFEDIAKVALG